MQEGFKKDKVKNICKVYSGATPSTSNPHLWNGDILWITPNDLSKLKTQYFSNTERKITKEGLNSCSTHLLPKGTLVMSSRAPIGYLAISESDFTTNQGCKSIVVYENYDSLFFYYNFQSHINKLKALGEGTTFAEISKNYLEEYEISFPESKAEQIKIAAILSTVDKAISQSEILIAKYQRIKTGLMQDLLTKGIDAKGNIRSKATHKFVVKKGVEVPQEWDVDTLDSLIKAVDAQPDHRTPTLVENGIPYLGISDIDENGNVDFKKCRKVSTTILAEHNKRYTLKDGDILFGKIGTVGEPKRLKAVNNITISANVILIQPHETPAFIFWVLNSEYINAQVKNAIHSTSQPAFGMEKIRRLVISIPPKKERVAIQEILNQNESNILSSKKHLSKLNSIKTGLMQDLLSGKVRVK